MGPEYIHLCRVYKGYVAVTVSGEGSKEGRVSKGYPLKGPY